MDSSGGGGGFSGGGGSGIGEGIDLGISGLIPMGSAGSIFDIQSGMNDASKALANAIKFCQEPMQIFPVKGGGTLEVFGYDVGFNQFGSVGMSMKIGYNGTYSVDELKWFQIVRTDLPLKDFGGRPNEWSIDPQTNKTGYPFFYRADEKEASTNILGYKSVFIDHIARDRSSIASKNNSFYWQAEVSLVRVSEGGREPLATLSYGFNYGQNSVQGAIYKYQVQLIEPDTYHLRLLNRKGY